jgi:hypothetical protein
MARLVILPSPISRPPCPLPRRRIRDPVADLASSSCRGTAAAGRNASSRTMNPNEYVYDPAPTLAYAKGSRSSVPVRESPERGRRDVPGASWSSWRTSRSSAAAGVNYVDAVGSAQVSSSLARSSRRVWCRTGCAACGLKLIRCSHERPRTLWSGRGSHDVGLYITSSQASAKARRAPLLHVAADAPVPKGKQVLVQP